ncbi:hypothetical protein [Bradyrhizobium sp. LMG 9283]|uniref:hypothetical protein n=1 Tax=Bradyrhizobium sp. LMG 9283 TaxID=592064 RepID=UPI00388D1652
MTGAKIDDVIATTVAGLQLAAERQRPTEWRKAEQAASRFRALCDHLDTGAVPRSAPKTDGYNQPVDVERLDATILLHAF